MLEGGGEQEGDNILTFPSLTLSPYYNNLIGSSANDTVLIDVRSDFRIYSLYPRHALT